MNYLFNISIHQGRIKLIKSDIKDIYNIIMTFKTVILITISPILFLIK